MDEYEIPKSDLIKELSQKQQESARSLLLKKGGNEAVQVYEEMLAQGKPSIIAQYESLSKIIKKQTGPALYAIKKEALVSMIVGSFLAISSLLLILFIIFFLDWKLVFLVAIVYYASLCIYSYVFSGILMKKTGYDIDLISRLRKYFISTTIKKLQNETPLSPAVFSFWILMSILAAPLFWYYFGLEWGIAVPIIVYCVISFNLALKYFGLLNKK